MSGAILTFKFHQHLKFWIHISPSYVIELWKKYGEMKWRDIFFLSCQTICVLPFLVLAQWWILVGLLSLKIPLFIKSEFGFLMLFKLLVLLLFFHMNFYLSWLLSSMFLEFDIFDHSLISFLSIAKCILYEVFGCRVFLMYLTVQSTRVIHCPT